MGTTEDRLAWIEQGQLGETQGSLELERREELALAAVRLATAAQREILIFSWDLDAPLYNRTAFLDAVRALALGSRAAQVRILLQTNERVQREGHRLVDLARRLSSRMEIRKVDPEHAGHPENFLLVDGMGYLRKRLHTRLEAVVSFHAPLDVRHFRDFFNGVWNASEQDYELRRLHL
jgi:hypothetical protein